MTKSVRLFGIEMNPLTMSQTIEQLLDWVRHPDGQCRYVVTPNVDHAVMFQHHAPLRAAYADAALVLADGFPVVVAARLLGRALPGRVPGSDLVPSLFETVNLRAAEGNADNNPLKCFCLCIRRWAWQSERPKESMSAGRASKSSAPTARRWGSRRMRAKMKTSYSRLPLQSLMYWS